MEMATNKCNTKRAIENNGELKVKVAHAGVLEGELHFHFGTVLKQSRTILHFASFDPVVIHAEGTPVDCLVIAKLYEMNIIPSKSCTLTFRNILIL